MNNGLGAGAAAVHALAWTGSYETWRAKVKGDICLFAGRALRRFALAAARRDADAITTALAKAAFAIGFARRRGGAGHAAGAACGVCRRGPRRRSGLPTSRGQSFLEATLPRSKHE